MTDQIASTAGLDADGARRASDRGVQVRLVAAVVLSAVTALCAALGVAVLVAPAGPLGLIVPLSLPHELEADRLLAGGAGPGALTEAASESRKAMTLSAGRASIWVREAYLDAWRNGRLTNAGARALDKSYQVSELGPDVSVARLKLVFEYWPIMPQLIRDRALREFAANAPYKREAFEPMIAGLQSPEGRLVAGMALAEHDANEALSRSN